MLAAPRFRWAGMRNRFSSTPRDVREGDALVRDREPMSKDPPKRIESEPTVVIDRDKLPPKPSIAPPSTVIGPTIEHLDDVEHALRAIEDETPTLDACPAAGCADCTTCGGRHSVECGECGSHTKDCPGTCSTCSVCLGVHMLSREAYAAWERENSPEPPPRAA